MNVNIIEIVIVTEIIQKEDIKRKIIINTKVSMVGMMMMTNTIMKKIGRKIDIRVKSIGTHHLEGVVEEIVRGIQEEIHNLSKSSIL